MCHANCLFLSDSHRSTRHDTDCVSWRHAGWSEVCKGVASALQVHIQLTSPAFQNALLAELLETMWLAELTPMCSYMGTAGYELDFSDRRGHSAHIAGYMMQSAPYFDGLFLHVWGVGCLDGMHPTWEGS